MKAILVADRNWAIGYQGGLLVHLPGDLNYFRTKTKGNIVIMGRATIESLPGGKPLPGRKTIILTRNHDYKAEGAAVCHSIDEAVSLAQDAKNTNSEQEIFVCGGGQIYEQLMPYCQKVLVTRIEDEYPADTFFPNLDKSDEFKLTWESEVQEENNTRYKFTEYTRFE